MTDFKTFVTTADRQKAARDYKSAIDNYKKALALNPQCYETLEKLADSYFCLSDFGLAIMFYECSLKTKPDYLLSLVGVSKAYELSENLEKAVQYMEKA